jgi:hypothetical protein
VTTNNRFTKPTSPVEGCYGWCGREWEGVPVLAYPVGCKLKSDGMIFDTSLVISHKLVVLEFGQVEESRESFAKALVDSRPVI